MDPIRAIALSGMQAAERRFAVSADNVVNARTSSPVGAVEPAYRAQIVDQVSVTGGGVTTQVRPKVPATYVAPDPHGESPGREYPNVDLAAEFVEQKLAVHSYKASVAMLRTKDEMDEALFDILS